MQTVIFLTTRTSATGSMWRTIRTLAGKSYNFVTSDSISQGYLGEQRKDVLEKYEIPKNDTIVFWNATEFFSDQQDLSGFKFIVNARDPRDLVVNRYWWEFSHPKPGKTPEQIEARHQEMRELGLEGYVLRNRYTADFDSLRKIVPQLNGSDWTFVGYALYCLHFDDAISKIASILNVDLTKLTAKQRELIDAERAENLLTNARWVHKDWPGADRAPGRHKQELSPATVEKLTKRYEAILEFLKGIEDPRLRHYYD
ncbi:hypothetical protein [Roseococcus thiosulfatophilus]|uniref:hypothetical protein n=1 Tax=Roseococcus thiosulfatophilus TaxID=35813 RepID=UPI001A8E89BA|nr:hypothetical protein [Roseococcus thiosulfatophilus]